MNQLDHLFPLLICRVEIQAAQHQATDFHLTPAAHFLEDMIY
jgi:hypothetical protein